MRKFDIVRGRELSKGERINNGAYAIVSRKKGKILRLTPRYEMADTLCDYDSRYLEQCWIMQR